MKSILLIALVVSASLFADEPVPPKLSHESEASVVLTSGNSDTQTFSAKQETGYSWERNTVALGASFLRGTTAGTETAKRWDIGLRYDRVIYEQLSAFLAYQIDSAPFAGTYLRHTIDLGAKYNFLNTDTTVLLGELGYRVTPETFTLDNGVTTAGSLTSHMSRAFLEWKEKWNPSVSSRLWGEYLQSFTNTSDYRFNIEPSISVFLSQVFSIKTAYLIAFRNVPAVAGKNTSDTTFTTSLVAKL